MGGKSGKQTVGYKYYLGQHLVLCHGPIDFLTRANVDDRVAWSGQNSGTPITINATTLFGGDGREGGVSGTIDVEMGGPSQGQNSYLLSKLGALVPAYRGVVGLVFRQCYLGNNPYLKPWAFRGQRIYTRQDGLPQWYPQRAAVSTLAGKNAIYIAIDRSFSMDEVTANGSTRLENLQVAVNGVLDYIAGFLSASVAPDIMIVAWGGTRTSITRRAVTASEITALKSFVNGISTVSATDFTQAVADVATFFAGAPADAKRTVIFATDGEPAPADPATNAAAAAATLFATPGISSFAFNIDLVDTTYTAELDNTSQDGVPVLNGSNPDALLLSVIGVLGNALDMNGVHIIRESLTDPDWGMGYLESDFDDTAAQLAADQIVREGLGTSFLWEKQTTIENFVNDVLRHIDAVVRVSRQTGKYVIKLIRDDYDPDDLILLDESNIARIDSPSRPAFGELINSVTVKYWDSQTGKDASVTVIDQTLVQLQGTTINKQFDFLGLTNARSATIVANRELRANSVPALSCVIIANSDAKGLEIGDTFKLSWSRWGLSNVVMRVKDISYGTARSNEVRINCVEDIYSTSTAIVVTTPPTAWEDPNGFPETPLIKIAGEVPYYEAVQEIGQFDVNDSLTSNPWLSYVYAAASRANFGITMKMLTDSGAGYAQVDIFDFSPYGTLAANISKTQTTLTLTGFDDLEEIILGTHFQIGNELLRVDTVDLVTGELTVGRGVLDTVPESHSLGDGCLFWDQFAGFDQTAYSAGETVDVKAISVGGLGEQLIDDVTATSVFLQGRAARPYPPGDLRLNGESYAVFQTINGTVEITWAHRDRKQQTSGVLVDHTAGNIGPEAGTVYRVRGYIDSTLVHTQDDITGTTAFWSPVASSDNLRVEVHSKRDGLYSLYAPWHTFRRIGQAERYTEEADQRYSEENGDTRDTED